MSGYTYIPQAFIVAKFLSIPLKVAKFQSVRIQRNQRLFMSLCEVFFLLHACKITTFFADVQTCLVFVGCVLVRGDHLGDNEDIWNQWT